MASSKVAGKPCASLPTGKPFTGTVQRALVAAHVNAYGNALSKAHFAVWAALPASQQAASAGCLQYSQQYAWRQHLRSGGYRATGGHWGAPATAASKAPAMLAANAAANKLAAAGQQGAQQAKQQAKATPAPVATPAS